MCDFYYSAASPPCRSVMMLAKVLDVHLNLKPINTREKEHLTPEFLKINPCHTIPTLVDDGFSIWESRAVLAYLAEKYGGKNDSLYPKDPQKRALVNQRLYFDMGTLYQRFMDYFYPIFLKKEAPDAEKGKKIEEAIEYLDGFLAKTKFVAGDSVTIADYALIASVSTIEAAGFDLSSNSNVVRWYNWCKTSLPAIEVNEEGLKIMKEFLAKMQEE